MKLWYFFIVIIMTAACNYSSSRKDNKVTATTSFENNPAASTDSANESGARLVAAGDCLTCHQVDKKSIGPSYMDISNKYELTEANVDILSHKIIHGGSGRWGTVAMTPHPNLTNQDASTMVRYILSLKTNAQKKH